MLRTCLVLTLFCFLSGTMTAQQAPSPRALNPNEKTGRSIFQTRCAMCHVGQAPASEMATDAAQRRPATLGPLLSKTNASDEMKLRQKIKDGSRLMPGYKHTLNDEQIDQVIAFMKTIAQPLTRIAIARAGE